MKLIAGIPEDVLAEHNGTVKAMKLQAYQLALDVARMRDDDRKHTGYKNADEVILSYADSIEKLTVKLEKKYPA